MTQTTFDMMEKLPDRIEELIVSEEYQVFLMSGLTVCALTLVNGTVVTGDVMMECDGLYDVAFIHQVARLKAKNKIAELEGYLTAQRLFEGRNHNEPAYQNKECNCDGTDF